MSHLFAYLSRLKLIQRWGLMSSARVENVQEHTLQVAQIAHALAVIQRVHFAGTVNPERVATLALFHDAGEAITGDLPAPIKYFNPQIATAYKALEAVANERLLAMVPPALAGEGSEVEIEILGKRHRATVIGESPFDPDNERLRA